MAQKDIQVVVVYQDGSQRSPPKGNGRAEAGVHEFRQDPIIQGQYLNANQHVIPQKLVQQSRDRSVNSPESQPYMINFFQTAEKNDNQSIVHQLEQPQLYQPDNYLIKPNRLSHQSRHLPGQSLQNNAIVNQKKQVVRFQQPAQVQQDRPQQEIQGASEQDSQKANRAVGIIILLSMAAVVWAYGWASQFRVVSSTSSPVTLATQAIFSNLFIITAIFTIIGFGLLFVHFKKMSQSAFFVSFFITSLTIIFSPLIQKFWYNVFITNFSGPSISTTSTAYILNQSMGGMTISIDFYNLKFSLINAISQLVVMLGLFGRLNALQITIFSFLYNFAWSLNNFLIINLQNRSPDTRFFDDYQIASVYLFAGSFGLIACLLLKKPPITTNCLHSSFSAMFAQLGTFFLFLSFCGTTTLFVQKTTNTSSVRIYVWQEAFISTFFALSASILFTYAFSILFGDRIQIRQSVFGIIMGAVIYGSIAQTCVNIGAALACGSFAGLFSAFFYQVIYKRINKDKLYDSYGVFLVAIISLIGTLGVAPLVIYTYSNYNVVLQTLPAASGSAGSTIPGTSIVGYILEYVGITVGIGLGSGLIVGFLLKCMDKFDANKLVDDKTYFTKHNGLRPGLDKQRTDSKVGQTSRPNDNKQDLHQSALQAGPQMLEIILSRHRIPAASQSQKQLVT